MAVFYLRKSRCYSQTLGFSRADKSQGLSQISYVLNAERLKEHVHCLADRCKTFWEVKVTREDYFTINLSGPKAILLGLHPEGNNYDKMNKH